LAKKTTKSLQSKPSLLPATTKQTPPEHELKTINPDHDRIAKFGHQEQSKLVIAIARGFDRWKNGETPKRSFVHEKDFHTERLIDIITNKLTDDERADLFNFLPDRLKPTGAQRRRSLIARRKLSGVAEKPRKKRVRKSI